MPGIVVGVDPSPSGTAALDWAVEQAVRRGVPLTAVRATTVPHYAADVPAVAVLAGDLPELLEHERALARSALDQARERVEGGSGVAPVVVAALGATAQVLLEAAGDAELLVVGSRGSGALSRAVLGSVSWSVLHHARVPVAVVPERRDDRGTPPRVVVGVDHSPASLAALAWAVDEARRAGAVVAPVMVRARDVAVDGSELGLVGLEASERRALEVAAEQAGAGVEPAVQVRAEVLVGHPAETLVAEAGRADLLVVGSRGRGGFASLLLGSTSSQCAVHATCPVVVVRDAPSS